VFYFWLSTGIAIANKESFFKLLDPDSDADRQQNLIDCFPSGMTEVTTDTTDRNDRPVAVGGIGNYAAIANFSQ